MGNFSRSTSPTTVPTDTIIPLHSRDDVMVNRAICVESTMCFDDAMDTEKMRCALERLMEIGKWRKLGARLRLNGTGKLEYHIPERYDTNRPGFTFDVIEHDMHIDAHPIASTLPKGTDEPTIFPSSDHLNDFLHKPDTPTCIDDWIYTDRPQLDIYLVKFQDATLMRMTFLHTLMDGLGRATLLKAWTAVLSGREDVVPQFHGFAEDPLEPLGVKSRPWNYMLSWFGMLVLALRMLLATLWPTVRETRLVCVPGWFVTRLRETALQELELAAAINEKEEPPFVSESDILVSWWTRTTLQVLNPPPNRTIAMLYVFNLRSLFPNLFPRGTAFVGNALAISQTFLTVGQILQQPISFLASHTRHSLLRQRTQDHVKTQAALSKGLIGSAFRVGPSDMMTMFTNGHQAKFFEMDFSGAIVRQGVPVGQSVGNTRLGKPSFIFGRIICNGGQPMNSGSVTGKDANGRWWFTWNLERRAWEEIERRFKGGIFSQK